MLVLFDHGTPRTLARHLIEHHTVTEARARGWERVENGELLTLAEEAGFEVLVTTDQNLGYQQNLTSRRIAIVVLGKGQWGLIKAHIPEIVAAVNAATPGSFTENDIPYPDQPGPGFPWMRREAPSEVGQDQQSTRWFSLRSALAKLLIMATSRQT